ncbi:hypothetical protein E5676_scaffold314G00600 [Cucumis melo var. makuwa]|uniref:Uncharacterized protein n=1 Tax=Cucumis melo var. makuwa TaxID=1194695 RepID=A0A5A7UMJ2_CUCMM|nr:hypothetical protein E6C27_scaffold221G00630 [Cucumis melo var. makuwa]TYK08966.1 hypothetical protein E5676_scaffold314G00600 [Cucumis melo var. makuwa]
MAQKQLEERMKMGEKEILGLKKLIFDLTKSVEKLLDDVNKRQDVSCAADGVGNHGPGSVAATPSSAKPSPAVVGTYTFIACAIFRFHPVGSHIATHQTLVATSRLEIPKPIQLLKWVSPQCS